MSVKVERRGVGGDLPSSEKAAKNEKPAEVKPASQGPHASASPVAVLDAAVYVAKGAKIDNRKDIRSPSEAKVVADDVSAEILENEDAGLDAHSDVQGVTVKQHLLN